MECFNFYDVQTPNPGVMRIRCPLLAFFGTRGDVRSEEDLKLLKSSIQRQPDGHGRITTVMIQRADHMYAGEEAQVGQIIVDWAGTLLQAESKKADSSNNQ